MDSEFIKSVELNGSEIRLTSDKDTRTTCIETKDEMLHLYNLEQIQTLKSMLYEIIYWWETIDRRQTK